MEELSRLLAARTTTSESRPRASSLERSIVVIAISTFFGIACAFAVVGFLALAVFFAAVPRYGEVKAACLAALAAALVMAVLGFSARRFVQPQAPPPAERPSPLGSAAQVTPPKTIWDLVALVVAGVAAGLSQQKR